MLLVRQFTLLCSSFVLYCFSGSGCVCVCLHRMNRWCVHASHGKIKQSKDCRQMLLSTAASYFLKCEIPKYILITIIMTTTTGARERMEWGVSHHSRNMFRKVLHVNVTKYSSSFPVCLALKKTFYGHRMFHSKPHTKLYDGYVSRYNSPLSGTTMFNVRISIWCPIKWMFDEK